MTDRPENFSDAMKKLGERGEAPILSEQQADVINSDYVDSADEVLAILERSERLKSGRLNF